MWCAQAGSSTTSKNLTSMNDGSSKGSSMRRKTIMSSDTQAAPPTPARDARDWARWGFVNLGILPILLVAAILFFALNEERFLSAANLFNVGRQSTFLII